MFDQVEILADWQELPPGYAANASPIDSLRDLGQQIGPQGFTVKQSFDDGLPDSVTLTTGNDASGSMTADLVGRQANIADTWGTRGTPTSFGTSSGITPIIPDPVGAQFGDYVLCAITFNLIDSGWRDLNANPDIVDGSNWTLLAEVQETSFTLLVFGRVYSGSANLSLHLGSLCGYTWVTGVGFHAETNLNTIVDVRPGKAVSLIESAVTTTHTLPAMNLPGRGWTVGFFATGSTASPWAPNTGDTEIVEFVGSTMDLAMMRSPFLTSPDESRVMKATSGVASQVVAAVGIPLIVRDRPYMDAAKYFSPFNVDSPVKDFERDTAPVQANVNVVTAIGVLGTRVFTGQMADISVSGRVGALSAVSQSRIEVDGALQMPTVFGRREGCTTDWIASFVAANGGQYAGVAPSALTRWWAPCHGSMHPAMDGPLGFNYEWNYLTAPGVSSGTQYPISVDGPFYSAMEAHTDNNEVNKLLWFPDQVLPTEVPGIFGTTPYDLLSVANNEGRISFWIKGDVAVANPAANPGNVLFSWQFLNDPGAVNNIRIRIDPTTRNPIVTMDASSQTLTGGALPSDGNWHFVGFSWKYSTGVARVRLDNTFWDLTGFTTAPGSLPQTDASLLAGGGARAHTIWSTLPIAEMQLECGPGLWAENFGRFWPTPTTPSRNMTTRPTHQRVEVVAETAPVQGWTLLGEVAESTSSHIRLNELDNLELFPLDYFGEAAQMTPELVAIDTDTNAADLDVKVDPTLTRNSITVQYSETRVDSNPATLFDLSSAVEIPKGVSTQVFALDVNAAEIHGALNPYTNPDRDLVKLTTAQVTGVSPLPANVHFMTPNLYADGTSGTITSTSVNARIISVSPSTVTVRFTNTSGKVCWLANSGQGIPFLRILGYGIRAADAFVTATDPRSIGSRRVRALTATAPIRVQNRFVANDMANRLLGVLARPRIQLNVSVMGDPRRKPGNLVTLADAQGTKAAGTWRVLSVTSTGDGPQYTQVLQLIFVGDIAIWDQSNWDEGVWGP
jgi:hypothetical protein